MHVECRSQQLFKARCWQLEKSLSLAIEESVRGRHWGVEFLVRGLFCATFLVLGRKPHLAISMANVGLFAMHWVSGC